MKRKITPTTYFLPLVTALALSSAAQAGFLPVPLTPESYTHDIVVESNATPALQVVTTASVDNGIANTANTWMEQGFDPANPANGLPPAGTVVVAVSNANYSFKMPPSYTGPNGILIDTVISNGTFTLTVPASYTLLSFLSSGGNGGDNIGVRVHHQDGSTETSRFGSPDWFGGTSNVAVIANERCGSTTEMTYANQNSGNPRLYFRDMPLTNSSPVTSIDLYYLSGQASSHNDIVGVSGATTAGGPVGPIDVTGYDYDFVVEATAPKRGPVLAADGQTPATTATMDTGEANTGYTWYEIGHNYNDLNNAGPKSSTNVLAQQIAQSTGIPHAGAMVTNAAGDRVFQMPPDYTTNNATILDATITSATLTFASPTAAAALSFLASGGGGGGTPEIVAHHADGFLETNIITVPDWFNDSAPYVIAANGRVAADSADWDQVTNNSANPRLFSVDALLLGHTASPITSVDLFNTNAFGGTVAILAVSANPGPLSPILLSQPSSVTTNAGTTVQFIGSATADVAVTYQWQKGSNGTFANLTDSGNVSGSTTATLTLANVGDAEEGSYRLVATDTAGTSTSSPATLIVLSPLSVVTAAGDPILGIPNNGNEPNEGVEKAIDGTTSKYLNGAINSGSPAGTAVGFEVTPSMGRTRVSALQLIAANDGIERDPANSILEGSDDGGATWTLISSNAVAMPDARNAGGTAIDSTSLLGMSLVQLKFANTNGYALYRWTCTQLKNQPAANSMQIGEVRLLGVADTSGKPSVGLLPTLVKVYETTNAAAPQTATLTANITGTPTPTIQWQKNSGTGFVGLTNGGNISGATSATVTISPTSASDAASYRVVASNTAGSVTSSVVVVEIISTLPDVTQPGDVITDSGNQRTGFTTTPENAIDDTTAKYENPGSGLNVNAGFPPFGGPVSLIVTPASGSTIVTGIRIYTAEGNPERDPADFTLEGSNDGSNFVMVSSSALSLPVDRNATALQLDPLTEAMQEVLFANNASYTTYRVTFNHVRDDSNASELQFAELELLGVAGVSAGSPKLSFSSSPGSLTVTSSVNGTLQSTTALNGTSTVWVNGQSVTAGTAVQIPIDSSVPAKFYRVKAQ
jgi:hypothetical protein